MADSPSNGDDFSDLLDQVDRDVSGWKPEPGDKVWGVVSDITEGHSEWGPYPLITIKTPKNEYVNVHCFHTVLQNEIQRRLDKNTLNIGDQIAIAYVGLGEDTGKGNPPEMYRVAIRPA